MRLGFKGQPGSLLNPVFVWCVGPCALGRGPTHKAATVQPKGFNS